MALPCCDNTGGRVSLEINGKRYDTRGGVTIRPQNFAREEGANDNGTMFVTTKPKIPTAEFKFSWSCGLNWKELTRQCKVDATITLIDMGGLTFLFTKASVIGDPEFNTETGEVTGLKIASANVREL